MLVPGAWHGAWCFRHLVEELAELGHDAVAIDLPCDEVGLTQHDYARVVGPQPDAIVVGHSLAGYTIPFIPARKRVYLAALLPVAGDQGSPFVPGFGGFLRDRQDRSYWPDPDVCAAKMYPDCTRAQSDWAFFQLRPQARVDREPAPFGAGDVAVVTTRDAAVSAEWQARVAHGHGARVVELDAGHSPFLTQPDELAELLDSLA